jgi:hypothetical protein
MPNPYHFRARIDRLWRRSQVLNPGYIRLKALNAIVREVFAPTERARLNQELYFATDPYDVARHQLRDLYDRAGSTPATSFCPPLPLGEACPVLDTGGWGEGPPTPEEESPEEDDDPL